MSAAGRPKRRVIRLGGLDVDRLVGGLERLARVGDVLGPAGEAFHCDEILAADDADGGAQKRDGDGA